MGPEVPKQQKVIGFLNDGLRADWSLLPWEGMRRQAALRGAKLVLLDGNCIRESFQDLEQHNVIYEMGTAEAVDGLVIWLASLAHNLNDGEKARFVRHFGKPIVTLEGAAEGFPLVDLPNAAGMEAAVEHLVTAHGLTRIGFVGMYANHPGFTLRFQAFRRVLDRHGLKENPLYIQEAWEPGREQNNGLIHPAVRQAWAARALEAGLQGLVCVADSIAHQMVDTLERMGVRVPQQCAVISFDGFKESLMVSPPVSAARPDWEALGERALDAVLDLVIGLPVPPYQAVPFSLDLRASCGCPAPGMHLINPQGATDAHEALADRLEKLIPHRSGGKAGLEDLIFLYQNKEERFLDRLDLLLREDEQSGRSLLVWQDVISILNSVYPRDIQTSARILAAQYAEHAQLRRQFDMDQWNLRERGFSSAMTALVTQENLNTLLQTRLEPFGIPGGWLVLFEKPGSYHFGDPLPEWSRVVCSFGQAFDPPEAGRRFQTRQILPQACWDQGSREPWIVESLHTGTDQHGYLVLASVQPVTSFCELLRDQVSSAVRTIKLMEDQKKAFDDLRQTQRQLVLAEKMGTLATLVAGVAHELGTPIGNCMTLGTYLEDQARTFLAAQSPGEVTSELSKGCQKLGTEVEKVGQMLMTNLLRVGQLIENLKKVVVDQRSYSLRTFQLKPFLEDVVMAQGRARAQQVLLDIPAGLGITSYPGALHRVMELFLDNAFVHGFSGEGSGRISLLVQGGPGDELTMIFSDNGCGMDETSLNRLFIPLNLGQDAKKRIGLGTFEAYNLITQVLQGTVLAQSAPGQGLTYVLTFPHKIAK